MSGSQGICPKPGYQVYRDYVGSGVKCIGICKYSTPAVENQLEKKMKRKLAAYRGLQGLSKKKKKARCYD